MGSIAKRGVDSEGRTIWRVDVGKEVDGVRRRFTGTVHGTKEDARILESRLTLQLDKDRAVTGDVTLGDYFDLVFVPNRQANGRVKATLDSYIKTFNKWIRPGYGSRYLRTITPRDARDAVAASTAQRNVLRTFRAVMNAAYDDERIENPVSFKRIATTATTSVKDRAWTSVEAIEAAEALHGTGFIEFVLLAGMAGLRKEEILSLTPGDFSFLEHREAGPVLMISVNSAYTDDDGLKATKTPESVRRAPAVIRYQDRLAEIVRSTAPKITVIDGSSCLVEAFDGWVKSESPRWRSTVFDSEASARAEAARITDAKGWKTGKNTPFIQVKELPGGHWAVRYVEGYRFEWEPRRACRVVDAAPSAVEREAMREWYGTRIAACTADCAARRWGNALRIARLRHVPISSLRHFSESVQAAAGVPASVVAKLHGHTNFTTDFTYYIDHGDTERVQAAVRVDEYLSDAGSHGGAIRETGLGVRLFPTADRSADPPFRRG